jgi:hypothetical protein
MGNQPEVGRRVDMPVKAIPSAKLREGIRWPKAGEMGEAKDLARRRAGFDDVEGEAALELHAGCTEDSAKGTRCAALLANYFADVAGSDMKPKYRRILFVKNLYTNRFGVIDQRAGNLR